MKKRYTTKAPRRLRMDESWYDDDPNPITDIVVYEMEEPEVVETGVLDHTGQMVYAINEREPIGYLWFDENDELRPRPQEEE